MSVQDGSYSETQGIRLLREMADRGRFVFTVDDVREVSDLIGVSRGYLRQMLSQLLASGWIQRLRRGLYAWSGTLPGGAHIHPLVIATRVVQPSAISHWSAMGHHGLTEQIPQVVMASTPKKVVTPSMRRPGGSGQDSRHSREIGGVRYEYVSVKPEHFFGIDEIWVDQTFTVPITDPERTLLDLFAQPRLFGGMGEALTVLEEHIVSIDVAKLVGYAVRYGKGSVAKRLGWSLERIGAGGDLLVPLLDMPAIGYRILDPVRPHRGPCDSRWHIQDNLQLEIRR